MRELKWSIAFLLVAFILLISVRDRTKTHYDLYFNGVSTHGVVSSVYRKNKSYYLIVSYDVNNKKYRLKSKNRYQFPWIPEEGQTVKLLYNPAAPESSEVYSSGHFFVLPAVQLIFSIGLVLLAISTAAPIVRKKITD